MLSSSKFVRKCPSQDLDSERHDGWMPAESEVERAFETEQKRTGGGGVQKENNDAIAVLRTETAAERIRKNMQSTKRNAGTR